VPAGNIGEHFSFKLKAWGGKSPYVWNVIEGQLPAGLALDKTSGVVSGVPYRAEKQTVRIRVKDSSIAFHSRKNQAFIIELSFIVR
jgi:hypothetical protein